MDFGFGLCLNLLKKVVKKNVVRISIFCIVYEVVFLCYDFGMEDLGSVRLDVYNGGVLGYRSKEEVLEVIYSIFLFEDVLFWIYWDEVYGGDVFKFGDFKLFLENEGIFRSVEKLLLEI